MREEWRRSEEETGLGTDALAQPQCYAASVQSRVLRAMTGMETEEQIFNVGVLVALAGTLMPWISGEWLGGESVSFSGFGFYTSYIGIAIFLLQLTLLLITAVPLLGGPVLVRRKRKDAVRFGLAASSTLLMLACLSVLLRITLEFTRMEMRLGIYVTLVGCLVTLLYGFLRYQDARRSQAQEVFSHPEDAGTSAVKARENFAAPPPPPPPPPPAAEEHRLYPR